ncbi:MAG: hypothetical protein V3V10_05450, partial [Planctomycetota bacterium]
YSVAIKKLQKAPSGANYSRSFLMLSDTLLSLGYISAAMKALDIALSQDGSDWEMHFGNMRCQLLVGDFNTENLLYIESKLTSNARQQGLGSLLLSRFMFEASQPSPLETLKNTHSEMLDLAKTFESENYYEAREALAFATATIAALESGEKALHRGLPLALLPEGLRKVLISGQPYKDSLADLLNMPELA